MDLTQGTVEDDHLGGIVTKEIRVLIKRRVRRPRCPRGVCARVGGAFAIAQLFFMGGCGGSTPSGPGTASLPPAAPAGLSALIAPALGVNAVTLSWSAVAGVDGYTVELGKSSGTSEVSTTQVPGSATSVTLGGLQSGGTYFARAKARNQAGTSAASNEVRIESVDLRDVIDALYFGSGPLIPRDGLTACISPSRSWITYPSGVTVRLIMSSSTVSAAVQQLVQRAADDWVTTTNGTNSVIVQLTGEADPRPGSNEITVATHPDPISQGCGFERGCTILTIRSSLLVSARAILGPSIAAATAAYSHDAVGHGGLGMCHIDGGLIGGARNTLMGGGPNVFSCSSTSDICIATSLSPLDAAAARAVYGSGLPRGAPRSAFLAAGLVSRSAGDVVQAVEGIRRIRIRPDTEMVIIDHRP